VLVDSTTREAPVSYRHDFSEPVKFGLGGLEPLGQSLHAGPPDQSFGLQPVFGRCILDATLHNGHAKKRNSLSSQTKDTFVF